MTVQSGLQAFHEQLVRIPSISHQEMAAADFVQAHLEALGAKVLRLGDNVIAHTGNAPRLLLNSHLDTVPPCAGWTRDPYEVENLEGRIYGLGSNDAKGPASAMVFAFQAALEAGIAEIALMMVPEEETGGRGTEVAWPHVRDELGWNPEGIIVGEPTGLQIGSSQSGMLVLELVAHGEASHAANADPTGGSNPVFGLAEDLARLKWFLGEQLMGATAQPTLLAGSTARNQVPSEAKAILDVRTSPEATHEDLIEVMRGLFLGDVNVISERLKPFACSEGAPLIAAIRRACPDSEPYHSPTMSDLVYFQGCQAVKFGPGESARSHTADEFIMESELTAGTDAYLRIIEEFLA